MVSETVTMQVEPKSMRVLMTLATCPGEVVTRQELFDAVWPGESVTDDVLTRAIAELRKRFGDSPGQPRVIETIRGRGYRLIAGVEVPSQSSSSSGPELGREVDAPARPDVARPDVARSDIARSHVATSAWTLVAFVGLAALSMAFLRSFDRREPAPEAAAKRPLQIHPLTGSTERDRDPDVSSDGTAVVYSQADPETDNIHLFLKLHDADSPLQLTSGPYRDRLPVFSPDGTRLSFVRRQQDQCGIFQIPVIGGPARRLSDCPAGGHLRMAWSPDGRFLARSEAMGDRRVGIALLDIATLESRPLTQPAVDSFDQEPTYSPDGKWLAFNRSHFGGVSDLYAVRIETLEERRLTHDFRDISGQSWTDDPAQIAFSSDRAGIHSLWRVGLEGGEPQWMAGGSNKIKHPSHARHSGVIAYEEWQYEINLWRLDLSAGEEGVPEAIVRSTAWDLRPSFSPDGTHLSFTSTRTGSQELWLAKADGSEPMRLTNLGSGYVGQASWSPDSQSVVFSAHAQGQTDLYRFDLGDVSPVQLTDDVEQEVAPSWSSDGKHLYFSADRGDGLQIWTVPADRTLSADETLPADQTLSAHPDQHDPPVVVARGSVAVESPDGRSMFLARVDDERIWRIAGPSSTAVETEAVEAEGLPTSVKGGFGRRHRWQADASGILFLEHSDEYSELKRLPWLGDESVTVARVPRFGHTEFTVSPDGRFLIYARTDRAECDILVARNLQARP
ncbi:MAG: winged helix-turn-helix domain-containing protein [Acidobacteriota bacterium]